jgi:hypothetical protein
MSMAVVCFRAGFRSYCGAAKRECLALSAELLTSPAVLVVPGITSLADFSGYRVGENTAAGGAVSSCPGTAVAQLAAATVCR